MHAKLEAREKIFIGMCTLLIFGWSYIYSNYNRGLGDFLFVSVQKIEKENHKGKVDKNKKKRKLLVFYSEV